MKTPKNNFYLKIQDDDGVMTEVKVYCDKGRIYFDEDTTVSLIRKGSWLRITDAQKEILAKMAKRRNNND